MKIAIMGAGAIGCYLGGRLSREGQEVVYVARPRVKEELETHGLSLIDVSGGKDDSVPKESVQAVTSVDALRETDVDVVLVCVKSAQTAEAGAELARVLPEDVLVVSMQNGVRNADVLREHLPKQIVLAGIVSFNVVAEGEGKFRRATTGPLVIEFSEDARAKELAYLFKAARFEMEVAADVRGMQWSKLVMNLNNAVSALCDAPTPTLIFDPRYRRIVGAIMGESIAVMEKAGIKPRRLGPLPVSLFPTILKLPTPILSIVARAQLRMDPEARSSMWQDLAKGRLTEVDHLNGEIVRLAESCGAKAPLNTKIVELVHDAEKKAAGSPKLGAEELWSALHAS